VNIKGTIERAVSVARGFWYAIAPFLLGPVIFAALWFALLGGVNFHVSNESSLSLRNVTLQRYSFEGDGDVIWVEDLDPGESEWRYTLPGNYGVLLRYERDGKEIRYECRYGSHGASFSVEFHIQPDGEIWCSI
jgi:hypothetical protein